MSAGYVKAKYLHCWFWSRVSMLRKLIACVLVVLAPAVMISAQTGTAVLYGTGSVYLNGAQLSNFSAVTTGDVIQTKETGAANLNGVGASVVIQSNTIVPSQSGGLSLDRGTVSVATGERVHHLCPGFQDCSRFVGMYRVLHFARRRGNPDYCAQEPHQHKLRADNLDRKGRPADYA